ncbi:hypothetical protein WMY93_029763 [Mugilogobius chulae]|uniref:Uncharacterized protein n=1 Tax=Mugilogobius chulae TaxID=88201 RepID=A0AAW0MTR3_9GOBI
MTCQEVRRAFGDDNTGYLVNVLQHKTVQTYGHAKVYLTEEYDWRLKWPALLNHTVPSNGFFFNAFGWSTQAWEGQARPTFMTIHTAVATYAIIIKTRLQVWLERLKNKDISTLKTLSDSAETP